MLASISFIFQYPAWFIILCVLLGAAVAFFTYQRNSLSASERTWDWPVPLLAGLRFLAATLLAFLLLSPLLKNERTERKKPVVIIATDNSKSVLLSEDSSYYKTELPKKLEALRNNLADQYDVRTYRFSDEVDESLQPDYKGKGTDLSQLYQSIYSRHYNQNIGAVITLTDGIYTQGQNPLLQASRFNSPIYTVALGDTIPPRDILVRDVQHNQIVYSGNKFPLRIALRGHHINGENLQMSVVNGGKTIHSQTIKANGDDYYQEVDVQLQAGRPGTSRYTIQLARLSDELSYENNTYDVIIEVLESKKRILLVAHAPHPDLSALRRAIEANEHYETELYSYNDFMRELGRNSGKLRNYQLAILHQLPAAGQPIGEALDNLKEAGVAVWYIVGGETDLSAFNRLGTGLHINAMGNRTSEALPTPGSGFTLFDLSEQARREMPSWPPLSVPFGEYRVSDRQRIALLQQIGQVRTDMPLLMFSQTDNQKVGILSGTGLWRWYMFNYAQEQSHEAIREVVNKTVQYLAVRADNRQFRVRPTQNVFNESDKVTFEAELYNESYEAVPDQVVRLTATNEEGKNFDFTFAPKGSRYVLDAGFFPAGVYNWQSNVRLGNRTLTASGTFLVKKVETEYLETVANHGLLMQIANQTGGRMLYPKGLDSLPSILQARDDIRPVAYMQTDFRLLIDWRWLFGIILLLLAAEWFIRKYFGSY